MSSEIIQRCWERISREAPRLLRQGGVGEEMRRSEGSAKEEMREDRGGAVGSGQANAELRRSYGGVGEELRRSDEKLASI